MTDKELSQKESLALITEMIGQAKHNIARGGSFHFLLWGWVVFLANLGHFTLEKFELYDKPYLVWMVTLPTAMISATYSIRQKNRSKVKVHLQGLYGHIWIAVMVGIVITLLFMENINYNVNAVILAFAGMGTYISGQALRFRPLILGGLALWVSSLISYNLTPTDQYLVGAMGILAGYLIPGYLLRKAEK